MKSTNSTKELVLTLQQMALGFMTMILFSTTASAAICSFARTDETRGFRQVVEYGELKLSATSTKSEIYTTRSGRFDVVLVLYPEGGYDLVTTDSESGIGYGSPWTAGSDKFPTFSKSGGPDSEFLEIRCSAF